MSCTVAPGTVLPGTVLPCMMPLVVPSVVPFVVPSAMPSCRPCPRRVAGRQPGRREQRPHLVVQPRVVPSGQRRGLDHGTAGGAGARAEPDPPAADEQGGAQTGQREDRGAQHPRLRRVVPDVERRVAADPLERDGAGAARQGGGRARREEKPQGLTVGSLELLEPARVQDVDGAGRARRHRVVARFRDEGGEREPRLDEVREQRDGPLGRIDGVRRQEQAGEADLARFRVGDLDDTGGLVVRLARRQERDGAAEATLPCPSRTVTTGA